MNIKNPIFVAEKIWYDNYERIGVFKFSFEAFLACMLHHRKIMKETKVDWVYNDDLLGRGFVMRRIRELRQYRIIPVNIYEDILSYIKKRI